jgi:undecaprenyl-diphosphatase
MLIDSLDRDLLLALNSVAGNDTIYLWRVGNNDLLRGFPVFFSLVALWFSSDCEKRRSQMLAGLLAVGLATVLSVWMQYHLRIHLRPLLDQTLPIKVADPAWRTLWDRPGSFPSDTGTLFFSLVTVIFLQNRLIGLFCFFWTIGIIVLPRIIFGWHYPSDILGSLILGSGAVFVFSNIPLLKLQFERALSWFESRMYLLQALLFIYLAEAYNMFRSVDAVRKLFL